MYANQLKFYRYIFFFRYISYDSYESIDHVIGKMFVSMSDIFELVL